ncbi:hypothetical protein PROFUN_07000 [Planoprotostelium fungivorum]|uniref:Major facilitator superfamily (MFS) profile domain-containing protein n=1 Tax=Planoprotostelium fungivorum TaxID=1890364 RepID=A0A2P6NMN3_9EUKA|nr:hypothetical protein PROFUN_07000 [Planoprotostelium fungivorum]
MSHRPLNHHSPFLLFFRGKGCPPLGSAPKSLQSSTWCRKNHRLNGRLEASVQYTCKLLQDTGLPFHTTMLSLAIEQLIIFLTQWRADTPPSPPPPDGPTYVPLRDLIVSRNTASRIAQRGTSYALIQSCTLKKATMSSTASGSHIQRDSYYSGEKSVHYAEEEEEQKQSQKLLQPTTPTPQPTNRYLGGIALMLFITFLSSVVFSIVLPSILPFLKSFGLDDTEASTMTGWAVCLNSAGSFISSPILGWWADKRSTREVVAVSLIIMIFGNIMYSLAYAADHYAKFVMLGARFIVGLAAGNYAVAQTYLSYATDMNNRTLVMGLNSLFTILGFVIGPAFSLVTTLSFLQYEGNGIKVDSNTSPGYLSAIFSLLAIFSLVFLKEVSADRRAKNVSGTNSKPGSVVGSGFYNGAGSIKSFSQILKLRKEKQPVPWMGVTVCLILYFIYTAAFTVFETIGTSYTLDSYQWGTTQNSYLYMGLGGICIISIVLLQVGLYVSSDRTLLVITTLIAAGGFGAFINYPVESVPEWRFGLGVALVSAGYATSVALLIALYTKILDGLDQGMFMGWLSSSGSVARMIGPLSATYIYNYKGALWIFTIMCSMMTLAFVITIGAYRKLAYKNSHGYQQIE